MIRRGPRSRRLRARAVDAGRQVPRARTSPVVSATTGSRPIQAAADAGADAIEIGIPFSDPVMDGPTIQAGQRSRRSRRAQPRESMLDAAARRRRRRPARGDDLLQHRVPMGHERFAIDARRGRGVAAASCPTCPRGESGRGRGRRRGAESRPSVGGTDRRRRAACRASATGAGVSSTASGSSASPACAIELAGERDGSSPAD